jgi:hypothetical protein
MSLNAYTTIATKLSKSHAISEITYVYIQALDHMSVTIVTKALHRTVT